MKRILNVILAVTLSFFAGCAGSKTAIMWTSADLNVYKPNVYVILPFENWNLSKYKAKYPEAAEILREAFETAFLETGHRVVERNRLEEIISELRFSMFGLTEEQGITIGKMLNVDAVIFGTVKSFYRGSLLGDYTTVGFSVKAVHVGSGVILWKGSHTKTTKWIYDYDPRSYASEVAKEIVQELIAKEHLR